MEPASRIAEPAAAAPLAVTSSPLAGEDANDIEFDRLKRRVALQSWIIAGLTVVFGLALPFAQPVYLYFAMNPAHQTMAMMGLDMPNMTNRAILAWATTSITEVMTMGFGDIDYRVPQQKIRFTTNGWKSYGKAFIDQQIGETFKKSQLVLTTAPSNTPVILGQGVNEHNVYEWIVQMPVIMTYATNNNVMQKQRAIITLVIVRVPSEEQSAGIAIDSWHAAPST